MFFSVPGRSCASSHSPSKVPPESSLLPSLLAVLLFFSFPLLVLLLPTRALLAYFSFFPFNLDSFVSVWSFSQRLLPFIPSPPPSLLPSLPRSLPPCLYFLCRTSPSLASNTLYTFNTCALPVLVNFPSPPPFCPFLPSSLPPPSRMPALESGGAHWACGLDFKKPSLRDSVLRSLRCREGEPIEGEGRGKGGQGGK